MTGPIAFLNGEYIAADRLALSVADAGLAWGACVVDRLRTFQGRPFLLERHLERFRANCRSASVPLAISDAELTRVTHDLIATNRAGGDVALVWMATPGLLPDFAPTPVRPSGPTVAAYTLAIDEARLRQRRRAGVRLRAVQADLGVDPAIKHRSRLAWWIASAHLRTQDPDAEPLWVDRHGRILETAAANVIAVIRGQILSPPLARTLAGVSRGFVMELAESLGWPCLEADLTLETLRNASEVCLTGTTACLTAVAAVDDIPFIHPGPVLETLLDAWSRRVGVPL